MKSIVERLKARTPKFFKFLRGAAISIGTSAAAINLANTGFSLEISQDIMTVVNYTIGVCAGVAGTASFGKENE